MKSRFLKALNHELPRAGVQSVVTAFRIRPGPDAADLSNRAAQPPTQHATPAPCSRTPAVQHAWRFSSAWREKPADNFAPSSAGSARFFHSLIAAVAVTALALSAGCKAPSFSSANAIAPEGTVTTVYKLKPLPPPLLALTNQLNPELLQAPTNFFTLGPGDKLDIMILGETNSETTTVVGPDGKIYFNLLPGIDVWGLTLGQTRQMLEQELSHYLRGQPQVNVTLRGVESKHVWLLGRFQQPGVYSLAEPTTLLEAIAAAGGSQSFAGQRQISEGGPLGEDLADLRRSFLVRNGRMVPVDFHALLDKGDLSQNIYLQPDDFVYFAPAYAKEVYVLGAVTQPKPVQYVQGMTLLQAIAGSYGTIRDAYLFHVAIVRGSLARPQVAVVNYYDIVKGHVPDVALEPNDVVYVPFAPYRYLRNYLDAALNTFVSSVAINAGTKLTTPNGTAPGITIPAGSGITIVPPPAPPIH
jgi:polysaccharide export outer membrane protein